MKLIKNITLIAALSLSGLSAHTLWVNSFEAFAHKPGHITVSLGWGHTMPMDDILNSPFGKAVIKDFSITDPEGEKIALNIPSSQAAQTTKETRNFDLFNGDIGLQKLALKKDSLRGVYKIAAKSKPTYYTMYLDNKDRQRLKLKPKDEVKNVKTIVASLKYEAFATSYLNLGDKWKNPKATNQGLEILPRTDLSKVKVGDLVEFEVFFYGKPLNNTPKMGAYITANSQSFGQSDNFSLFSRINKGKAQFRVQSAGQWKVECKTKARVTKDAEHKNLYGKTNTLVNASTLTFHVKE